MYQNGSYERAVKKKKHLQYQAQPQDDNYNRGLDLYNACIAGAEMNTDTYFRTLIKYKRKILLLSEINTITNVLMHANIVTAPTT